MNKIHNIYSQSKLDYNNLELLPYKIIREKNDNFYNIVNNSKIRRDFPWKSDKSIVQSTTFDLNELCLLSRIHILDAKVMRVDVEIASDIKGPYTSIERDMEIVAGKIRIIKVGSLPCRYFRIKVTRGCQIMDYSKIECYGFHINEIKNKYDDETLDILFYNSYDLIYRKEELISSGK